MADVLRTTQPAGTGFENNQIRNQPQAVPGASIENAPNPSRVMNPDGRTEQEDSRFSLFSNSNFEAFIRELKSGQGISEALENILFADPEAMAASGREPQLSACLSSFLELISVEEGDLLPFVKNQAARTNEFGEPFFRALKAVFDKTPQLQLKTAVLRAVSRYSDLSSGNHTLRAILAECKSMLPYLFPEEGRELEAVLNKLTVLKGPYPQDGAELFQTLGESFDNNRQVLLKELFPFFSDYIKKTHDMGVPREKMFLITDQVARYMNGSPDEVRELFSRLLTYSEMNSRLAGIQADQLTLILGGLLKKHLDGEDDRLTDGFCSLVESGLKSGGKEQFLGIMSAMLRGESAYLPLLHIMVPFRLGQSTVLSELFIDPDADGRGSGQEREREIRILMKLEIKGLGAFDLIIGCRDRQVDLQILYPPSLQERERDIRTAVSAIALQNGLTPGNILTEIRRRPPELSAVFPKLMKRKDSVNVRV